MVSFEHMPTANALAVDTHDGQRGKDGSTKSRMTRTWTGEINILSAPQTDRACDCTAATTKALPDRVGKYSE